MKNNQTGQENKKTNIKAKPLIVAVGVRTKINMVQRIFIGFTYVASVAGVSLVVILAVVTWPVPIETAAIIVPDSTANSITLNWTAPGDDENIGQASEYDIRYATWPITEETWFSAQQVENAPSPKIAGSQESSVVRNLTSNTKYYFAIKSADEIPNWSAISNIASKTTDPLVSACVPDWSCTDWSVCSYGLKIRDCNDLNNCETDLNMPITSQECVDAGLDPDPEVVCQEDWSCTKWSKCSDSVKTRYCIDLNKCGSDQNKPLTSIDCVAGAVGGAEPVNPQERYLAVTPTIHGGPHLKLFDENLQLKSQFFTYSTKFRKGVNPALGDVDGDGQVEVVSGTGPLSAPHIRIFDVSGNLKYQFFAYPRNFRIGVSVATGDVDGDGRAEIIVAPQEKGGPHIRVFKYNASLNKFELFKQFFAFPTHFRMGVNVASGDLNNDGLYEIVIAPRNNGGPHVRIFSFNPQDRKFKLYSQFFAYIYKFRGGVSVEVADVDGDGIADVITGAGPGGGPHVRIFNAKGKVKYQFFAASPSWRGGLDITAFDYDQDGFEEVVTSTYSRGLPGVKIFNLDIGTGKFEEKEFFLVFPKTYQWGIRVAGY